jgi:hypothetical protein
VGLSDEIGNIDFLDQRKLMNHGINAAFGVGTFEDSFSRAIDIHGLRRVRVEGYLGTVSTQSPQRACLDGVPIRLERKRESRPGWRLVSQRLTDLVTLGGYFKLFSDQPLNQGRFRIRAVTIEIGTPALATCLQTKITIPTGG